MKTYDVKRFNQEMRSRSRLFSVNIYNMLTTIKINDLSRIPVKQLMRSATSVAANFSSATRGRSDAEFYSRICIVTEECDECLFWIDFLSATRKIEESKLTQLKLEAETLLKIFSVTRRNLKVKLSSERRATKKQ